jgi:hypothetical protein
MTKILGISGKKQSGKSTAGNFLFGCAILSLGKVEYAEISKEGELILPYENHDNELKPCVFPVSSRHPAMMSYMKDTVWDELKVYNFADNLKEMCIEILGLTERQCYGTEEEKNTETQISWDKVYSENNTDGPPPGWWVGADKTKFMTAREVMQYVGTDFFRKIYPDVWVDSTIRKIEKDSPRLAVVVDCRFPNEVEGIKKSGGKVIRLNRNVFGDSDQHPSETALDGYENFDCIIDNQEMTVAEQNEAIYNKLAEWDFINFSAVAQAH